MFRTLVLLSLVMTVFLLFAGSFIAALLDRVITPEWVEGFRDVVLLNPDLRPADVVVGTLLSYFIVTALLVILLHVSREMKQKNDVYDLEGAVKNGIVFGLSALVVGGIGRFLGLGQHANLCVPLFVFLYEARENVKSAVVVSLLLILVSSVSFYLALEYKLTGAVLTPLYYIGLVFLPPLLVWLVRSYIM